MDVYDSKNMIGGWFIGCFQPSLFNTSQFEVAVKHFVSGEYHASHFHKIATEYNYIINGSILIRDTIVFPDQIFVIHPMEVSDIKFLQDTTMVVVKVPSVKDDKYESTRNSAVHQNEQGRII